MFAIGTKARRAVLKCDPDYSHKLLTPNQLYTVYQRGGAYRADGMVLVHLDDGTFRPFKAERFIRTGVIWTEWSEEMEMRDIYRTDKVD